MYSSFYKPSMQAVFSKTKTEARSRQISKTKHPKFKTCVHFKNTRQSLVKSPMLIQQELSMIANGIQFKTI